MSKEKFESHAVQTTGHAWDGDLQEYNNPLPRWWVWAFYFTIVFAVIYWFLYPAWPWGKGYTTGLIQVTYTNDKGETKTTHWNTRAELMKEMNEAALAQKPYYDRIAALTPEQIVKDPEALNFVMSAGKQLFADNCAACHQSGGQGVVGLFPNLTDDDWLYGGTFEKIQETITYGRRGYMPAFGEVLSADQIDALAHYELSLSNEAHDATKAQAGDRLFHSMDAACFYCHGDDGRGRQEVGAPNLTDKIWLWANVPAAKTPEAKLEAVKTVIRKGLNKGVMPAWKDRLKPEQIKLLTVYVHELGGGK